MNLPWWKNKKTDWVYVGWEGGVRSPNTVYLFKKGEGGVRSPNSCFVWGWFQGGFKSSFQKNDSSWQEKNKKEKQDSPISMI